jgi:transcriptional regulator with XRE-family HTH domain
MRKQKKKRLESKGWKIGTVKEFLGLSNEESAYIELKIEFAAGLRRRRQQKGLSQLDLAAKLQSSQSRVAMEAGDPSVSLDLLIRSLINLGATEREYLRSSQLQGLPELTALFRRRSANEASSGVFPARRARAYQETGAASAETGRVMKLLHRCSGLKQRMIGLEVWMRG